MSAIGRLWFGVVLGLVLIVGSVQAHDAWRWATGPWLGFSLGAHGRIEVRDLADVPAPLRELLRSAGEHGVYATEVWVGERPVPYLSHVPIQLSSDSPRVPDESLRETLATLSEDSAVRLTVSAPSLSTVPTEILLAVGRVPERLVVERCGLYVGLGLLIAASGLSVYYLRPGSSSGLMFAVAMVLFGIELMTSQVGGGFRSRLTWLAAAASFAFPAAIAHLALTLGPRARAAAVSSIPWLVAIAAVLLASFEGSVGDDHNVYIRGLRVAAWLFFVGYLLWARRSASTRQETRRLELYLGGLALAFLPPLLVYARDYEVPSLPSPWVMLSLLLFPLVLGYGIVKHRLFDIDVFLRRSAGYTAALTVAAGIYGALIAGGSVVLGMAGPNRSSVATASFVFAAVAGGTALRNRLQGLVDRGLNPPRFRYLEALRKASKELASLDDAARVAQSLVRIATDDIGLRGAVAYLEGPRGFTFTAAAGEVGDAGGETLADSDPVIGLARVVGGAFHREDFDQNARLEPLREAWTARMDRLGAVLVLPLGSTGDRLAGVLALGPRRNGEPLNDEDLALLETLATTAAAAIARSQSRTNSTVDTVAWTPRRERLTPGGQIGHYRLEREVGRGGMGAVWKARDERLERVVALKFLKPEHAGEEVTLERTRREARALASLSHPGIVRIYALEEIVGLTFLAMEYIDGPTLAQELAGRGRFSPLDSVAVGLEITAALQCAFTRGVIHRDVKPENALLAAEGVKLTDFGLARSFVADDGVTASGAVVGTLPYLAPELFEQRPASFQSDMYALGVTLHTLVTGRGVWEKGSRPWFADGGRIDATTLRARGVPDALVPVLDRLLQRDPVDRYRDYAALEEDLTRARDRCSETL